MFAWMSGHMELVMVTVAMMLLVGPIMLYLVGPWVYRRDEILDGFTKDAADLYFGQFHPNTTGESPNFKTYYNKRFGRYRYALPLLFVVTTGLLAVDWAVATALQWLGLINGTGGLSGAAVSAVAGAYIWVIADVLWRWQFRDLQPVHVCWLSLRFIAAVPIATAFSSIAAPALSVFIAFAVSAFPTRTLLTITRRLLRRQLDLGEQNEPGESELERLQGINTRVAERFADEGFTTIGQLAWADPVELTMRCSSFSFSFVIDCTSQALAWLYLEDHLSELRVWSLRGAQEISAFIDELDAPKTEASTRAILDAMAVNIHSTSAGLERVLREVAEDPYTKFLGKVWQRGNEDAVEAG
jgi:hypothetical protein